MNLNLYDNSEDIVYKERENRLRRQPVQSDSYSENEGSLSPFPSDAPLAMAYVRYQQWGNTLTAKEALDNGTLFSDLIMPFEEPAPSFNADKTWGGNK